MADWNINWAPWGGVSLCLDEGETKTVFNASDIGAAIGSLVALAPSPVQLVGGLVAAYLSLEKGIAESADQGNGVCFFLAWVAIAAGQIWAIVPSTRPGPSPTNQQHVNYIGSDGHVHELMYSDSGGWNWNDLTGAARGADAAFGSGSRSLDGYATPFNGQQHVNYIDNFGWVHELMYAGGTWHDNNLASLAGEQISGDMVVSGYQTSFNNQQHVDYLIRQLLGDVQIVELWYSDASGAWQPNRLTSLANAAEPAGGSALAGYETAFNCQQHVNFIGSDGHIHELWYSDSGGWKDNDISSLAQRSTSRQIPLPAAGSALAGYVTTFNNQLHVDYVGTDGHLHELWYSDSGGWQWNDLTWRAQATPPAAGTFLDGYQTTYNNQQHVNYIGTDGHVHELWFSDPNGAWMDNDLSWLAQATTMPAPGSCLDGYATTFNNQQHVNYIGTDGHVHELWYSDSGGWKENDLSLIVQKAANREVPVPATGSPVDGYQTT